MPKGHQATTSEAQRAHTQERHPSHAESARTLVAKSRQGVLATLERQLGYPYASVVEFTPLEDGSVVFLLSDLAEHTINIGHDPRVTLLVADGLGAEKPLAKPRLSLIGRVAKVDVRERYRDTYTRLHPGSERYLDFSDFNFYHLTPKRVRYIGGFGRMGWLDAESYLAAEPDPLWQAAAGILQHMHSDHAHNLVQYAKALAGLAWAESATMLSVDRYGFDMQVQGERKAQGVRLHFPEPATTPVGVRRELVRMAKEAREILGEQRP